MERFEKNPDFLQDLFVEETWKNIERLDSFIESKSGTEQVEITKDEVNFFAPCILLKALRL